MTDIEKEIDNLKNQINFKLLINDIFNDSLIVLRCTNFEVIQKILVDTRKIETKNIFPRKANLSSYFINHIWTKENGFFLVWVEPYFNMRNFNIHIFYPCDREEFLEIYENRWICE